MIGFRVLLIGLLLFYIFVIEGEAGSAASADSASHTQGHSETAGEGAGDPLTGFHATWDDGLHLVGRYEKVQFEIGGNIMVDGGRSNADDALNRAFPDFEGGHINLRWLSVSLSVTFYDALEGKFEIDFANTRDVKDNWIRFTRISVLDRIKFGHQKEAVSLEELISIKDITFMERALPVRALAPGRNLGINYRNAFLEERMTWAFGGFWETGSLEGFGEARDRLDEAAGLNLTTRITGFPWYENGGKNLIHLGLSYSYQFRDENDPESTARYRSRPESRLTDDRFVDTGDFSLGRGHLMGAELAFLHGPFSFQGEYLYSFNDSELEGDPAFWGYYLYISYVLTGESRGYKPKNGVFSGIRPKYSCNPRQGNWGAWELALRYSYVDLNDAMIKGGEESNFTAGLNWYLFPRIRCMFNYIRVDVEDRGSLSLDEGTADIFQARLQFAF
jgi:phosphate-selective porin OprO/OprP